MIQAALHKIPSRMVLIPALFTLELIAIVVVFQLLTSIECHMTTIEVACRGLRGVAVRAFCFGAMLGIYLWARADARRKLSDIVTERSTGGIGIVMHLFGLLAIFLPLLLVTPAQMNATFGTVFPVLVLGAILAAVGGVFWLAAPSRLFAWFKGRRMELLALTASAMIIPGLADALAPIWYWDILTQATFKAVALLLSFLAEMPVVDVSRQVIGANGFLVTVADSCSGIEGLALITAFLALYAVLFRDMLYMGRFWLVVWPVALLLSLLLNVLRITALIMIGGHLSPELAVNGFHSFAGWLFFTALSIGVLIAVNRIRWLQKDGQQLKTPLADDDFAARIMPFIIFMLSGIIVQAFWSAPELGYPLQVVLMAAALWWYRTPLAAYLQRPSTTSVLAGLVVGVIWVALAPEPEPGSPALAALSAGGLLLWGGIRIIGTVALVPLIEELFFRGYIVARLDTGSVQSKVLAVAVSTALFALLHGRWIEAGLAGLVFALLYMQRGRLIDAIAAHAIANTVIAAVAAWQGNWSLI